MRRRLLILAVLGVALAVPSAAHAVFAAGAQIVSADPSRGEQANGQTVAVDISQDGRYVAFQTRARNLFPAGYQAPPGHYREGGIFRRDLVSGALGLVAPGTLRTIQPDAQVTRGAANPSINGDGRFISFSSGDQLVAADVNTRSDVYVRDMEQPIDSPSAFELVSARDGSEQPATYGGPPAAVTGAELSPEGAVSADGRKVVFATRAVSDLPAADLPTTPSGQLFVRDLDAHTTALVTRNKLDGTPAGAATSLGGISADGSTVVWSGRNAALQTRLQPGEDPNLNYYMWRRVADGPSASTRRITGLADVDDPGCPESEFVLNDTSALGPCYGPLAIAEDQPDRIIDGRQPSLSADGMRVAFQVGGSPRPSNQDGNQLDVWVTDMTTGLSRKAATRELTRESQYLVIDSINTVKISADGNRIAFVSARPDFVVATPRLVSPPVVTTWSQLYIIHLDRMEVERVTSGWDGSQTDGRVSDSLGGIALSGDGHRVAFVSGASNLLRGDANSQDDAFIASEEQTGGLRATGEPPFADVVPREDAEARPGQSLPVRLSRGPNGAVRVTVRTPGAGQLRLTARARIKISGHAPLRPVARARKRVRKAGTTTVLLRPAARYRRYLHREKRLRSRLEIRFAPAGPGRALTARRTVSFTS